MVSLAERYTSKMAKKAGDEEEVSQLQSCLLNLGIDNPVTRDACKSGNVFHRELAKELAVFLARPIGEAKGLLPIVDVYCLYCRARGTQLVSPDDLMNACRLFEQLSLPFRLRTFGHGILAIEHRTASDMVRAEAVLALARANEYLTCASYAAAQDIPVLLAEDHLTSAERAGKLCRDDSIQGLRFYPNRLVLEQPSS
jgi:ESCRT-II complex subunit VPS36